MLTADEARNLLDYNAGTGAFTWKARTSNRVQINDVAGSAQVNGYRCISILGKRYLSHRLAWLIVTGEWPAEQIDHINGNRADNRFFNLREVSLKENAKNQARSSKNTSGVTGVNWQEDAQKWRARIKINGRTIQLGYFSDLKTAKAARKAAELEHGFHKNHGRA